VRDETDGSHVSPLFFCAPLSPLAAALTRMRVYGPQRTQREALPPGEGKKTGKLSIASVEDRGPRRPLRRDTADAPVLLNNTQGSAGRQHRLSQQLRSKARGVFARPTLEGAWSHQVHRVECPKVENTVEKNEEAQHQSGIVIFADAC